MNAASLSGRRVLVVEDDFYQADDVSKALRQAGAAVLGPYPSRERALASVKHDKPDCAILDINLGRGADFDLADRLNDDRVPFLFYTGYDQIVIPPRFTTVVRLQKPLKLDRIVEAVSAVLDDGSAGDRAT